MDFALQVEPLPYDPQKAKQLLAEAGYPNGLDAGEFVPIPPFFTVAEAAVNYLNAVGIRMKMRPMERAAFLRRLAGEEAARAVPHRRGQLGQRGQPRGGLHLLQGRATPTAAIPTSTICSSSRRRERDVAKREALLHRIQQLTIDRVMFAPIMDYRTLRGVGPRVAEHTLDSMPLVPFPAHEDMRLKGQ